MTSSQSCYSGTPLVSSASGECILCICRCGGCLRLKPQRNNSNSVHSVIELESRKISPGLSWSSRKRRGNTFTTPLFYCSRRYSNLKLLVADDRVTSLRPRLAPYILSPPPPFLLRPPSSTSAEPPWLRDLEERFAPPYCC